MPTTLTGLLLFVVLLLPGFAYLVGKERAGTERRTSPFRETVAVVAASVTTELAVVVASVLFWSRSLDVDQLIEDPGTYWREHPGPLVAWGLGLLSTATAIAYVATIPAVRRRFRWLTGDYPHPSSVSSWWLLFDEWPARMRKAHGLDDVTIRVACCLSDGSLIEGTVADFNQLADDVPDRDLILVAPIERRTLDGTRQKMRSHAACVSARDITSLLVYYRGEPSPPSVVPEDESGT